MAGVLEGPLYKHLVFYDPSGHNNERATEVSNLLTS